MKETMGRHIDHLIITVLAAVFWCSSAILCLTDIQPQIFHMPWLAFAGFCLGGIFMLFLLISMIIQKKKQKR